MSGAGKKWLTGCGIGCGLLLIVVGGIGTCSYFGLKDVKEKAARIDETYDTIEAEYGAADAYVPPLDGSLAADRLEAFLAVRDAFAPARAEMSTIFLTLDGQGDGGFVAKAKAGFRMISATVDLVAERNVALLEKGMGLGEYEYIYALVYFVFLERDPGDGPSFVVTSDGGDDNGRFRWKTDVGGDGDRADIIRADRARLVRSELNERQRDLIAELIAAVDTADADAAWGNLDLEDWRSRLAEEAEAMADDRERLLWEGNLPDRTRRSLEPYRDRLSASYDSMASIVEVHTVQHD